MSITLLTATNSPFNVTTESLATNTTANSTLYSKGSTGIIWGAISLLIGALAPLILIKVVPLSLRPLPEYEIIDLFPKATDLQIPNTEITPLEKTLKKSRKVAIIAFKIIVITTFLPLIIIAMPFDIALNFFNRDLINECNKEISTYNERMINKNDKRHKICGFFKLYLYNSNEIKADLNFFRRRNSFYEEQEKNRRIPGSNQALGFVPSSEQIELAIEKLKHLLKALPVENSDKNLYEVYLEEINKLSKEEIKTHKLVDLQNPEAVANHLKGGLCFGWTKLQLLRLSQNDSMTPSQLSSFSEEEKTQVLILQLIESIRYTFDRLIGRQPIEHIKYTFGPLIGLNRPSAYTYFYRVHEPLSGIPYASNLTSLENLFLRLRQLCFSPSAVLVKSSLSHNIVSIRKSVNTTELPTTASAEEYKQRFNEALEHLKNPDWTIGGEIHFPGHVMWFQYSGDKMRIQDSFCTDHGGIFECKTQEEFFTVLRQLCVDYTKGSSDKNIEETVEFTLYGIEKNGFEKERSLSAAKKAG